MSYLGSYTIAELKDLITAKDVQTANIQSAWDAFRTTWQRTDPGAAADWAIDWQRFLTRYALAKDKANDAIMKARFMPVSDALIPAADEYEGILRALTLQKNGSFTKGDIQDIYNRLAAARGAPIVMKIPQPSEHADADLGYMNESGKVFTAADQTLDAATDKLRAQYAKSKLDDFVLPAMGLVGLGLVYLIVRK